MKLNSNEVLCPFNIGNTMLKIPYSVKMEKTQEIIANQIWICSMKRKGGFRKPLIWSKLGGEKLTKKHLET